ncbi:hypothetical protein [Chitinivibrio alkaliphilus]|uniref:Uncharacterized protein n=1 Tax=Chitinivibrio alkaliphilus ACht1 TaxID=1313304 RepID=U7D5D9_9BACT|nr:hypothetical protein [Chitinivibrio alkaliphilus]ERP30781.1 hypothetical protein CALK_2390 [Chitinivibrio alkaliphilus ACht1]
MPIPFCHGAKKYICQSCGWSAVRPAKKMTDMRSPADMIYLRSISSCPRCKATCISAKPASGFDRYNPFLRNAWKKCSSFGHGHMTGEDDR